MCGGVQCGGDLPGRVVGDGGEVYWRVGEW